MVSRRQILKAVPPAVAGLGVMTSAGVPSASADGAELAPALRLSQALADNAELVNQEIAGLGPLEQERALFFLLSAYNLADEMWFQKGDPTDPVLTNWELPYRKYGGDNPTTIYLSAPVSPDLRYRLRGPIGDAVYAGVQVYTKGPGFNAPSANISDTALLGSGREIDLLIGGADPGDGTPWLPLVADDYLVMVRLYHRFVPGGPPPITLECLDAPPGAGLPWSARADKAKEFFDEAVLSTIAVTEALRSAGVNRYPPPGATVKAPRYTGALFPTHDNVYDGFYLRLGPDQALRLRGKAPVARFWSFVFYDRWFNTPDIPAHRCFLTGTDIERDADGHYEVVLSPRDPGHPNWIDTAGLTEGIFAIRYLLPQERSVPDAEVISLG